MKKLLVTIGVALAAASTFGQGQLTFANLLEGTTVFPMVSAANITAGAGVYMTQYPQLTAQLFLVREDGGLTALYPATTFLGETGEAAKYLIQVGVDVPGYTSGDVKLRLRVWDGSTTFAASPIQGDTGVFTATPTLAPNPPGNLTALDGRTLLVGNFPEPSAMALGFLGLGALYICRRKY